MRDVTCIIPTLGISPGLFSSIFSALGKVDNVIVVFNGRLFTSETYDSVSLIPNVTAYFSANLSGPAQARQFGIDKANTTWITFLDDDDILIPDHFSKAISKLIHSPDVDIIVGRQLWIDRTASVSITPRARAKHGQSLASHSVDVNLLRGANTASASALIVRRSVFDKCPWYENTESNYTHYFEDYYWYFRASHLEFRVEFVSDIFAVVFRNANSLTTQMWQQRDLDNLEQADIFMRAMKKMSPKRDIDCFYLLHGFMWEEKCLFARFLTFLLLYPKHCIVAVVRRTRTRKTRRAINRVT